MWKRSYTILWVDSLWFCWTGLHHILNFDHCVRRRVRTYAHAPTHNTQINPGWLALEKDVLLWLFLQRPSAVFSFIFIAILFQKKEENLDSVSKATLTLTHIIFVVQFQFIANSMANRFFTLHLFLSNTYTQHTLTKKKAMVTLATHFTLLNNCQLKKRLHIVSSGWFYSNQTTSSLTLSTKLNQLSPQLHTTLAQMQETTRVLFFFIRRAEPRHIYHFRRPKREETRFQHELCNCWKHKIH